MNNKNIVTSELDFDLIKQNLKNYLKGQQEFSDYDFEGSGLSILLDILSYNTHYNALYTNLAINESFLDSASKRASVVSVAKLLGYTPNSAACPTATISLTVNAATIDRPPSILVLPKYSTFTTSIDNKSYTFYTVEEHSSYVSRTNTYSYSNVIIKEGTLLNFRYTYIPGARYIVPNPNIDLSTLTVRVKESIDTEVYTEYSLVDNIIYLTSKNNVYFIKEIDGNLYEIQFGNGVIGSQLANGNVIIIDYIATNKTLANNARNFGYNGQDLLGLTPTIYTQVRAVGGDEPEDIDKIRFNAPRVYSAQNRCVTKNDYESIILTHFPQAKSVNVWGGEDHFPPSYGDVYISVLPTAANFLTSEQKDYLLGEVLAPRKSLTIHNKLIEPNYIDVALNTAFYYDSEMTNYTQKDVINLVRTNIRNYSYTELEFFGKRLRYSQLSNVIDTTEPSITNNITTLKLYTYLTPYYNTEYDYSIDLGNPIFKNIIDAESVLSNGFYIPNLSEVVYIDDVPNNTNIGTLRLFYYDATTKVVVKEIGKVDYANGMLYLLNLTINKLYCDNLRIMFKPSSNDVVSVRNQIIRIPDNLVTITGIKLSDYTKYKFTPSRL